MQNTKPIWIVALAFVLIVLVVVLFKMFYHPKPKPVVENPLVATTTEEVATTTTPVIVATTTPSITYKDVLVVNNFVKGQEVTSPLEITGEAKGWYFEASFPVKVTDDKGHVLGSAPAQAQGDWMSTSSVPFAVSLTFVAPKGVTKGFVVLSKDNPSGLAKNDDSFKIPVVFTH